MDQTGSNRAREEGVVGGSAPDARSHAEAGPTESQQSEFENSVEWKQKIEALQAQADDYKDKYLRSVAEFSNYRKRQDREREQQTWRIKASVLKDLLDPLDDFRRALEHVPDSEQDSDWVRGIMLIEQKLLGLLSQYNVTPIDAVGKPFDPGYHDALLRAPSDEYPEGTVSAELRKGYMMDDQVLRPAVVQVSQGNGRSEQQDLGNS